MAASRACPPYLQDVPLAQFYPGNKLQGDYTNYWGPNVAGVRAMLRENHLTPGVYTNSLQPT